MVSSQLAAMNYAAHLARSLAVVETNPRRKEFLQQTDHKFSGGQVRLLLDNLTADALALGRTAGRTRSA